MIITTTQEWKYDGKGNYYWIEYRTKKGKITKYQCHRQKIMKGSKCKWKYEEQKETSWAYDDPCMPDWLKQYA